MLRKKLELLEKALLKKPGLFVFFKNRTFLPKGKNNA